MRKQLITILLLVIWTQSQCPANNQLQGITSDFAAFSVAPSTKPDLVTALYPYSLKQTFASTPNVGFGIWDINFESSSQNQFTGFTVKVTSISQSSLTFQFNYRPTVWKYLRVGFWTCSRTDILLGFGSFITESLRSSSSSKRMILPSIPNHQKSIVRAFLNGFSVNSGCEGFEIQIQAKAINENSFTVVVATGKKTDLKSVDFSYLLFSPSSAPFASYGGSMSRVGLTGITYQDISNTIYYSNMIIQGLVKVGSALSINLASNFDSEFVMGFNNQGPTIDFIYSYVVLGVPAASMCSNCRSQKCAYRDICVQTCPDNTYQMTYKDGGMGCRTCSAKLHLQYSQQTKSCICSLGYQRVNGQCLPTQGLSNVDNAIRNSGAVLTIYNNNGNNVPPTPPIISPPQNLNPSFVPSGATIISNSNTSYYSNQTSSTSTVINTVINSSSTVLPSNIIVPPQSYVPTVPTPVYPASPVLPSTDITINTASIDTCNKFLNTYWTGFRCSCRVGFSLDTTNGVCKKIGLVDPKDNTNSCGENQVWTLNKCLCKSQYIRNDNNRCVLYPECPPNSYLQGFTCTCIEGFSLQDRTCVPNNNQGGCGPYSQFNPINRKCECERGYEMMQNQCQPTSNCPPNSQYNPWINKCDCNQGFAMNPTTKRCDPVSQPSICNTYQEYDPITRTCKCKTGMGILSSGQCGVCPAGSIPDKFTQYCVACNNGKIPQNGVCVCPQLMDNSGQCYSCARNEEVQGSVCVCKRGYTKNPATGFCQASCPPPTYMIDGACGICMLPSTYDNQLEQCLCPRNYMKNNRGVCQPINSCNPGYYQDQSLNCLPCAVGCASCYNDAICYLCKSPTQQPDKTGKCVNIINYVCGNGRVEGTEECDDGNTINGDGCSNCKRDTSPGGNMECTNIIITRNIITITISVSQLLIFSSQTSFTTSFYFTIPADYRPSSAFCSQRPENRYLFDCYFQYTVTPTVPFNINFFCNWQGWSGSTTANVNPSSPPANPCGNGLPNPSETCDDGNLYSGDGCSSSCQLQSDWTCTSASFSNGPSRCSPLYPHNTGIVATNVVVSTTTITITLQILQITTIISQSTLTNSLIYVFSAGSQFQPSNGYCVQRQLTPQYCDCYFQYPSGTPTTSFTIQFTYWQSGTSVSTPVIVNPGSSASNCGNRKLDFGQACDDGNIANYDGCSSNCQQQSGWTCIPPTLTAPSSCSPNSSNSGMTVTNVQITINSITVTITINQIISFTSQTQEQQFIKYQFPSGYNPSTSYCRQATDNLAKFNCAFTYYGGVPQNSFTIQFSCSRYGYVGATSTVVNPNGTPTNLCGNGLPNFGEDCDDGNRNNGDGCSSQCTVDNGWNCTDATNWRPSSCSFTSNTGGLTCQSVTTTSNTVMVTLIVNTVFIFNSQTQIQNFMHYQFQAGYNPSSGYCSQRRAEPKVFDCYFTYASGVPQNSFTIAFSYSKNGVSGQAIAYVNSNNQGGVGMKYVRVILNRDTLYVILQLNTQFTFKTEQQMTSFMRYQIPSDYTPTSGYCRQNKDSPKIFDCLFNYPQRVPKVSYNIIFTYSKNGINGYLSVFIDVTKNNITTRSLT